MGVRGETEEVSGSHAVKCLGSCQEVDLHPEGPSPLLKDFRRKVTRSDLSFYGCFWLRDWRRDE